MQPMKLKPLYHRLIELELVDPAIRKALPMQVADGFSALQEKHASGEINEDEVRALFECALLLTKADYRGLAGAAQDTLMKLYATYPGLEFRPPAQDEIPPPPEADSVEEVSPL